MPHRAPRPGPRPADPDPAPADLAPDVRIAGDTFRSRAEAHTTELVFARLIVLSGRADQWGVFVRRVPGGYGVFVGAHDDSLISAETVKAKLTRTARKFGGLDEPDRAASNGEEEI